MTFDDLDLATRTSLLALRTACPHCFDLTAPGNTGFTNSETGKAMSYDDIPRGAYGVCGQCLNIFRCHDDGLRRLTFEDAIAIPPSVGLVLAHRISQKTQARHALMLASPSN